MLFSSLTESNKRAVSCRRAIRSLSRVAASCRMIVGTLVLVVSGDPGVPLRRLSVFLFDVYLVPLCFHNVYSPFSLYHREKPAAFQLCRARVSLVDVSSIRAASPPGSSCRHRAGSLHRPPWGGIA